MATAPHPSVVAIHDAANALIDHMERAASPSFWRRWFEGPAARHAFDDVRAFSHALGHLEDVPPPMIREVDLQSVGQDVDRVVAWIEAHVEQPEHSDERGPLSAAVYVIRRRYEELYKRGALGG